MKVKFHLMKSKKSSVVLISKKLAISDKLVKQGKHKFASQCRSKTFSTYGRKKEQAMPMLSYVLGRKKKKATKKVAMKNLCLKKTKFNSQAHCGKLMLNNFPFVMA